MTKRRRASKNGDLRVAARRGQACDGLGACVCDAAPGECGRATTPSCPFLPSRFTPAPRGVGYVAACQCWPRFGDAALRKARKP
eukprot:6205331-Pleurochrysis_carterae.AAC.1